MRATRGFSHSGVVFARGSLRTEHIVFCAALLLRLFALARLTYAAALNPSGGDMLFYQQWAERIRAGHLTDGHAFYGLPLYAYWLAAIYKLFGAGPFLPLFLQALWDAAVAAIIYKIAISCFATPDDESRSATAVALLAAAGWIVFVPAQACALVLMPTTFGILAFWLAVWCAVNPDAKFTTRHCLLLGMLVGAAAMAIGNVLFVVPLLLAAILRKLRSRAITAAGALVAGTLLGTAPSWAHNYFVARDPVFLSAHGGVNFWIGNNPEATGYPHFPGLRTGQAEMLSDSLEIPRAEAGHDLKRSEVSAYWWAKARAYIVAQPLAWIGLLARKFANFWNAFEYDDLGVIAQLRREHVITPGLHFGIVAALAVPGLLLAWRAAPHSRWIALALLLALGAVLTVFVTERYRLVAAPALLLFGAFGIVRLWLAIAAGKSGAIAVYVLVMAGAAAFVAIPRTDASLWALLAYDAGRQALDANQLDVAARELERSRAYVPDNPELNFALGNLHLAQGDPAAAQHFYIKTLTLDRRHKGALTNLGVLALEQNNFDSAEMYFRQVLSYSTDNAKAHFLLARALLAKGDRKGAATEIERALALHPDQSEFSELRKQVGAASR